ncbi:MAG TPA: hypothetical protein VHA56_10350 [Mucilaginibacter sp.]|nr:hypothetical protein [Mucilaginibacter sp.]
MKKLLPVAVLICGLLFYSCKKDNQNVVEDLFIGAFKNGSSWVGKPSAGYLPDRDSLQVSGIKQPGEENLYFRLNTLAKGSHSIKAGQAGFYTTLGGDAITADYILDTTQANTVVIRDFDYTTNIANGTFQLYFTKISGTGDNKVSFTGGKFYVYVPD